MDELIQQECLVESQIETYKSQVCARLVLQWLSILTFHMHIYTLVVTG